MSVDEIMTPLFMSSHQERLATHSWQHVSSICVDLTTKSDIDMCHTHVLGAGEK